MICPKCLTIEAEGSLKCRKCGAQLYTGVFQRPVVETPPAGPPSPVPEKTSSRKAGLTALGAFALAVAVLILVLALLELRLQ